jgi:drug/metabolite transporter (DMT)-like permease
MFTQPPVAILFAAIFLGNVVPWTTIVGMAVILLCIAILDGFVDPILHPTRNKASPG